MISIYDRLCISTLMSWCVCIRANTKIPHSYCIAKHSRFLHYYQVICIDTGNIMQFCERLFLCSVCKKLHCFLTIAWFEVTECVRTVLQLLLESRTYFLFIFPSQIITAKSICLNVSLYQYLIKFGHLGGVLMTKSIFLAR